MLTGIDHIVIAVTDLDEAVRNYGELGFTVVPGGVHPTGTHNALIAFADQAYIELIAFQRPLPEHRWWQWLKRGGGLTDVCLRTDDLAADLTAFRRAGIKMDDPSPLSRLRPDGYKLEWKLAIPETGGSGVIPFLIEDETPREERVPRENSHANLVTGISGVTIAVDEVAPVAEFYSRVLNQQGERIQDRVLSASGIRFAAGRHLFDILEPDNESSPVARWLAGRGPSIYLLTLNTTSAEKPILDESLALGARLSTV